VIDDDFPRETPPSVIGSIAAGVAPLPFLLVYSVIFISHGVFYPIQPPDITSTRTGEAIAGFLAVLVALIIIVTIWWFLGGRRRWTFVVSQLAVLVTTIAFVADPNTGSPTVPLVLIVTSAAALVLAFVPGSNEHMAWQLPRFVRAPGLLARRSYRGARRVEQGEGGQADPVTSDADPGSRPRSDVPVA
jgi:hypothetical protein